MQVLPMYLVQFKYDPDEDETKKVFITSIYFSIYSLLQITSGSTM